MVTDFKEWFSRHKANQMYYINHMHYINLMAIASKEIKLWLSLPYS